MKKLILLLCLLLSINVKADELIAHVVGITDGDTITVLAADETQYKVRLAGIDAPEKKQAFGNASKKSLSDLIFDKEVKIEYKKSDRYGRIVGKVTINSIDVNLEQVKRGMAWFYKKYQNELILDDRLNYLHAQELAISKKVGLWVAGDAIAPWAFRKGI